MADTSPTASFQVLAASVHPCPEGRRLLVRTRDFPAASLVFSEELAQAIGPAFTAEPPPPVATQLANKSRGGRA